MRNNHDSNRSVNGQPDDLNSAFCWGAEAIGAVIGRNPRQTHHLLTRGEIKSAKKVGGRWVVSRAVLLRELGACFAMSTIELAALGQAALVVGYASHNQSPR